MAIRSTAHHGVAVLRREPHAFHAVGTLFCSEVCTDVITSASHEHPTA